MDNEVVSQEPGEATTPETQAQESELGQTQPDQTADTPVESIPPAVDEDGIPFLNKYKEKERKLNELYEQMPTMIESLKSELKKEFESVKTQAQPKYTEEQLRSFMASDQGQLPENRVWAEGEISKLREERLAKIIDEKFQSVHAQQEQLKKKNESFNYVVSNYPDAFKRDMNGNVVGWDTENPLTKMIANIMQDERFRSHPDGLVAAADMAFARLSRSQTPKVQQQVKQLKSENKALQKNTMIEGGGKEAARISDAQIAMERLKKTGSVNDAFLALKAMAKR
jgi:hypothetical protein